MSEAIPAFVAYKANGDGAALKKKNSKKGGAAKGNKSTQPAGKKAKAGAKGNSVGKAKGGAKAKSVTKANGGAKANSAVKAKLYSNGAKKSTSKSPTPYKAGSTKTGKAQSGFNPNNELDEDLLSDNIKDPAKLKEKQELEAYLISQLANDTDESMESFDESGDESGDESEDDSDDDSDDSGDDSDDSDDGSDESDEDDNDDSSNCFTEEYTMNTSNSSATADSDEIQSDTTFSLEKLQKKVVPKRSISKSNENNVTSTEQSASAAKVCKLEPRKRSLPATECVRPSQVSKARSSLNANVDSQSCKLPKVSPTLKPNAVKIEPLSPSKDIVKMDSIENGKKTFAALIQPIDVKVFFEQYWEKNPCFIERHSAILNNLISFETIDQMLLNNHIEFTKNIDITSYKNGIRETLNPDGRALPPAVWELYEQGCSIRLLNPQTFLPGLWSLNAALQEFFRCMVGANAYLTPPNSQGFAPHYDDIEAFILQIEGKKRWKLYKPRNQSEVLPRFSSGNFTQEEIGNPIFEKVLMPGDLLYFPRGVIHQAITEPGNHSLHITLSVYQKQSYADLFEQMMPMMLKRFINSSVAVRRGLPLEIWQNAGVVYEKTNTKIRSEFKKTIKDLLKTFLSSTSVDDVLDDAVDQIAKKFQHEALPPDIKQQERVRTIYGSRTRTNESGNCLCDYEIKLQTNVRLLRANIMRLVKEDDKVLIYYYLENSKEYCEYEPNFIEILPLEAYSVELLIKSYPSYVSVSEMPIESDEQKIQIVTALWERGLLMTEKPI